MSHGNARSNDGRVLSGNSSTTPLNSAGVFTGQWEDVSAYNSVTVAVKTDQNGYYTIQFSPDGTNADSTLTRYYRTTQIEPPHRFTITRRYMRVVFTNNSGSNQTYLRLQTMVGEKADLNIPVDATMPQDYDATATRPTNYNYEVALGRRQGASTWNKFGYNSDVDTGTEAIWSAGGTFTPLYTAEQLNIASTSTNDTNGGTGANSIVVYGVDSSWNHVAEVVTLNGTTTVQTTNSYFCINRMAIYLAGSGKANAGVITATAPSAATTQAQMPAGEGTTQQCIFGVGQNQQFLSDWLQFNVLKISGGASPRVTIKGWVYSAVSSAKYEVFRGAIDTGVENTVQITPSQPFVIGEKSILWFEATTNTDNTEVSLRFSGILIQDVDA